MCADVANSLAKLWGPGAFLFPASQGVQGLYYPTVSVHFSIVTINYFHSCKLECVMYLSGFVGCQKQCVPHDEVSLSPGIHVRIVMWWQSKQAFWDQRIYFTLCVVGFWLWVNLKLNLCPLPKSNYNLTGKGKGTYTSNWIVIRMMIL
jgi:hypothetical protein